MDKSMNLVKPSSQHPCVMLKLNISFYMHAAYVQRPCTWIPVCHIHAKIHACIIHPFVHHLMQYIIYPSKHTYKERVFKYSSFTITLIVTTQQLKFKIFLQYNSARKRLEWLLLLRAGGYVINIEMQSLNQLDPYHFAYLYLYFDSAFILIYLARYIHGHGHHGFYHIPKKCTHNQKIIISETNL